MISKVALLLVLSVVFAASLFPVPKVAAWANNLPNCNVDLSWDWQNKINDISYFDNSTPTSKLVKFNMNLYPVSIMTCNGDPTKPLIEFGDAGTYTDIASRNDWISRGYTDAEYVYTLPFPHAYFITDSKAYTTGAMIPPTQIQLDTVAHTATPLGVTAHAPTNYAAVDVRGIVFAHGFGSQTNYTGQIFKSDIPNQDLSGVCSGALDIGCQVRKAFTNVTNAISDVAQAALNMIASFFIPDSAAVAAAFNNFNAFLVAKLGFITYPFSFLSSFFNAFSSSSGFCQPSSCVKDFGNFMGKDYSINLTAMQTLFPAYWIMFTGFLRGTLVLGLIMAIKREFNKTMER